MNLPTALIEMIASFGTIFELILYKQINKLWNQLITTCPAIWKHQTWICPNEFESENEQSLYYQNLSTHLPLLRSFTISSVFGSKANTTFLQLLLQYFPHLHTLNVSKYSFTIEQFSYLQQFQYLQSVDTIQLNLSECQHATALHGSLIWLRNLDIRDVDRTNETLLPTADKCPNLLSLQIVGDELTPFIASTIATHTSLTNLAIHCNEVEISILESIFPSLSQLTAFELAADDQTDAHIYSLFPKYTPNLTSLSIDRVSGISQSTFESLSILPLQSFDWSPYARYNCQIFEWFLQLNFLTSLDIGGYRIECEVFDLICSTLKLKHIVLGSQSRDDTMFIDYPDDDSYDWFESFVKLSPTLQSYEIRRDAVIQLTNDDLIFLFQSCRSLTKVALNEVNLNVIETLIQNQFLLRDVTISCWAIPSDEVLMFYGTIINLFCTYRPPLQRLEMILLKNYCSSTRADDPSPVMPLIDRLICSLSSLSELGIVVVPFRSIHMNLNDIDQSRVRCIHST